MSKKKHDSLPKDTTVFICADCGAAALDAGDICKVMGKGKKADWCGSKERKPLRFCQNKVNVIRWQCRKCGQVSVNQELLCKPERLEISE